MSLLTFCYKKISKKYFIRLLSTSTALYVSTNACQNSVISVSAYVSRSFVPCRARYNWFCGVRAGERSRLKRRCRRLTICRRVVSWLDSWTQERLDQRSINPSWTCDGPIHVVSSLSVRLSFPALCKHTAAALSQPLFQRVILCYKYDEYLNSNADELSGSVYARN